MSDHAVAIVGSGPTGMMLAAELALAHADVAIVERRPNHELDGSRSGGIHARTIEVLDQRGVADRFLAEGQAMQVQAFAGIPLDISDFPTRHNYGLALWQSHFEQILADWVRELGVSISYQCEVTGFVRLDTGVNVAMTDGRALKTEYLVGCDGGRSVVRKAAGIDFPGWDPSTSWLIAEVAMDGEPTLGLHPEGGGIGPAGVNGLFRIVLPLQLPEHADEPTMQEVRNGLVFAYGTDFGVHSPSWISRFNDTTRQATSYRNGRVLLAGDAAHVHAPQGGQGLNTGVQDAVNLGWKLARVLDGTSSLDLLDTYHAERHPVGARVLHNTMAQVALSGTGERTAALRDTLKELLGIDDARKRFAGMISGLDIHYDLGDGHPLLGRRMPDLDLVAADGPTRVYPLLHGAEPVLLNFGTPGGLDITSWGGGVQSVDAECIGPWELPVLGTVTAPSAVLIRPDGHVAWVGEGTDAGLRKALTTWFGAP